jgi:tryptophanyl-tRNA synthetase
VTELAWILSTLTPMGLLERCHSYKDKTSKGFSPTHGLFAYPVLMAADILIYESDLVPVGKDQKQHLEVTRDLVIKFNEKFGEVLKMPEASIQESTAVVPGTDGAKMSKSYHNTIGLFEDEKAMRKKFMALKTDSTPVESPKDTENSTILSLYKLVAGSTEYDAMVADFRAGGFGYGDFKKRLFDAVWAHFAPMRTRREELLADPGYVSEVLKSSAEKAGAIAAKTMTKVRAAVGL